VSERGSDLLAGRCPLAPRRARQYVRMRMHSTTTYLPYCFFGIAIVSAFCGITGVGTGEAGSRAEFLGVTALFAVLGFGLRAIGRRYR
jgi:hypothetical protein